MSETITNNKVVTINYRIEDENGELIEQTELPVTYIHGIAGDMHTKIEASLKSKTAGDTVEVILSPEDAFGQPDPNLIYVENIVNMPPQYVKIGAQAQFQNDQGETRDFIVTEIKDGKVTLDGNHPLAGKTLKFVVSIKDVRDASAEELERGEPYNQFAGLDTNSESVGNH